MADRQPDSGRTILAMIFFEEDDGADSEPRPAAGRPARTRLGGFAMVLSLSVVTVVLAVLGIGYLGSHVPDASLWAWIAALFDRS
jgi:hypothetical protein